MSRLVTVGAAQTGPIQRDDTRPDVVERLLALLREGADAGCDLVVFPELALTTFFPRWWVDDRAEFDHFFETEMPGRDTQPLFDEAARLGVGFHLGYAELTPEGRHHNTAIVVDGTGTIIGRYRKVHLPGHHDHQPWRAFQHLERYYFDPGEGFGVFAGWGGVLGMAICNDRRWPESYRMLGLQGCELALIGYNTPIHYAPDPSQDALQGFHNRLCLSSGAYQNGMWVVGVAKAGEEEGCDLLGESAIYAPSGEVVACCETVGDELVVAECDLDRCADFKDTLFDFGYYRRPEVYGAITGQAGVEVPADVAAALGRGGVDGEGER
jgi:predicted amidohydrolase